MMRLLFALLGFALLTAATPARDWSGFAAQKPDGAYVIGNPAARVKIVEYASYTCPHCAAFSTESAAVLKGQMVRSGSTSLEVRHYLRDPLDLAAAITARCAGPRGFAKLHAAIFAAQPQWLEKAVAYQQANGDALKAQAELVRIRSYADGSGLTALAITHGLSRAAINACFATRAEADKALAMTESAPEIPGTPTFFVNGKIVPNVASWSGLEPVLRAAGAR